LKIIAGWANRYGEIGVLDNRKLEVVVYFPVCSKELIAKL
jgi:hypothetical protein